MTLRKKILIQVEAVIWEGGIKYGKQVEPDYIDDDIIRPTAMIGHKIISAEPDDIVEQDTILFINEGCESYEVLRIFPISLEVAKENAKTRLEM